MRKIYLMPAIIILFIGSSCKTSKAPGNSETNVAVEQDSTSPDTDEDMTFTPPFQIGLGVGYNYTPSPRYDYYISATNNTLQRDQISKNAFVGSVVVAYAIPFKYKREVKSGKPTGKLHPIPGPLSILSSFNLTELNSSMSFNTSLNGGLGIGYNINNVMHLGLFCDFTKGRFLRDAYADSIGKSLFIAATPLTSLDKSDDRFFKDRITTSISFKVIFVINRRQSDLTSTLSDEKLRKVGLQ